jgi:hypothetical protein
MTIGLRTGHPPFQHASTGSVPRLSEWGLIRNVIIVLISFPHFACYLNRLRGLKWMHISVWSLALKSTNDFTSAEAIERLIETYWQASPLGARPNRLSAAMDILLPAQAQIVVFWGKEFVALYSEAYAPLSVTSTSLI